MTTAVSRDTARRVLDLPLPANDSGADTVRGYLTALLAELWEQEQSFNGKRPFGNSSWQYDIYLPLARAGLVTGTVTGDDEDGYELGGDFDHRAADRLMQAAIAEVGAGA